MNAPETDRTVLERCGLAVDPLVLLAQVAVALASLFHLLSVLVLYRLSRVVFPGPKGKRIAFVAASLHVLSPAGVFLSAPYAESFFCFCSFAGSWLYAESLSRPEPGRASKRDLLVLASSLSFAVATAARTNGVLNGALFLYDACVTSSSLLKKGVHAYAVRRLLVVGLGGAMLPLGMVVPQAYAYREYCRTGSAPRPWCSSLVPSIYAWVQRTYWSVDSIFASSRSSC